MDTTLTAKPRFALSIFEVGLVLLLAITALVLIISPFLKTELVLENNTSVAIPSLIGLVYLICGGWIFTVRRGQIIGKVFTILAATATLSLTGWSDLFTPGTLTPLWAFGILFSAASLAYLAKLLTQIPSKLSIRWFRFASFGLAFTLWLTLIILTFLPDGHKILPAAWLMTSIFTGGCHGVLHHNRWSASFTKSPKSW